MSRFAPVTLIILLAAGPALAEPYEVSYYAPQSQQGAEQEGLPGPWPEDQGWTRFSRFGTVQRSIENGSLKLEAFENGDWEFSKKDMNDTLDPGVNEYLFIEWEMVVDDENVFGDTTMGAALDAFGGVVSIHVGMDRVRDPEGFETYLFNPGVFHTFFLFSDNLVDYHLFVDGDYAFSDVFKLPTGLNSFVGWGDATTTYSSSRWKHFRFGAATIGDVNTDGSLNLLDFATFARCFGMDVTSPAPTCTALEAELCDFDRSGNITLNDFATFALNFAN